MSSPAAAVAAKIAVQTPQELFDEIVQKELLGLDDPKSREELQQLWIRFNTEVSVEEANLVEIKKANENEKQVDEKNEANFAAFQKKCQDKLQPLTALKGKIVKVFSDYYSSGTELIRLIPAEQYQQQLEILKEAWDFIVDVRTCVQVLAERSASSAYTCMLLYLQEFSSYNKSRLKVLGDIEKLSQAWKEKVKSLLQETSKIMADFYKGFDELLTASTRGFHRHCLVHISPDMYEGISVDFRNYVNPKLVAVNTKQDQAIQALFEAKKREYRAVFGPLKNILTESQLKDLIECRVASLAAEFHLVTFEDGEGLQRDPTSFFRFEYLFQKKLKIEDLFKKFIASAAVIVDSLVSEKTKDQREKLVESIQQKAKQECALTEVQLQEKRRQKEMEQARRVAASEQREANAKFLLLQKAAVEHAQRQQAIKMKIKQEILSRVPKMSQEEKNFMQDVLNNVNLHRKIQESLFIKLVETLGFPCQETNKSSGGYLVTIHNKTLSFHHWNGDNAGTLDGNFIKEFKDILEGLGIGIGDITEALKMKAPVAKK
jgi:hypothetical protein